MDTTEEQPFEIVHEEQQTAPTEADVNALLAASGPALEAAPAIESALSIAHEASHLESLPNAPVEVESEPAAVHQSVGSQEQDIRAETPATPIRIVSISRGARDLRGADPRRARVRAVPRAC